MKQVLNVKTLVAIVALALGGVAAGDVPELDQYDTLLASIATLLLGWVGIRRPGDTKTAPGPGPGGALALLLVASGALSLQACRPGAIDWPRVATCAPAPAELVDRVARVLLSDGEGSLSDRATAALEELARTHVPATVACAVAEMVDKWTGQARSVENGPGRRAAVRGAEFLDRVGTQTREAP